LPLLDVDGIFGAVTETRVKEFQRNNGLWADGVVGPMTYRKLAFTPAEYQVRAQRIRQMLVDAGASATGLTSFDIQVAKNINPFMKEGAAQLAIPVVIGLFLLFCAAVLAMSPSGQQVWRDLAHSMEQTLEELRNSLNLTPPSQVLAMIWGAIEKMVKSMVERLAGERKKCGDISPTLQAQCAKQSMAVAVAVQEVLRKAGASIGPGFREDDLIKGLLSSLGGLLKAYSEYGRCIGCDFIQFL
jgi:hypothetical protein